MILICILFLLLAFVLFVSEFDDALNDDSNKVTFPGVQTMPTTKDCNHEIVYSVDDEECTKICSDMFVSKGGVCVNVRVYDAKKKLMECSPANGTFGYLVGSPELSTVGVQCQSIDLGVQSDDGDLSKNQICDGGNIDIDYVVSYPTLRQCICKSEQFLAVVPSNSNIRARGFCVDRINKRNYDFNNLSYDPTRDA